MVIKRSEILIFVGLILAVMFAIAYKTLLVVAPFVVYALAILAIAYTVVLIADRIGAIIVSFAQKFRDYTIAKNEARMSNAEADRRELEVARNKVHLSYEHELLLQQVEQMAHGMIYADRLGDSSFASHTKAVASMNDGAPLLAEPLPKLATLLPKAQRILVAGGQNAGKTTVCQWIAYYKLQVGRVIIIDSHATPARWPNGCEVIGAGRDYDKIEALLRWMMAEMDRRFKDQAAGVVPERGHEIISVVSDEWTLLPEVIKDVERYTTPLLTETRKAGFDFYLAAHDTTVDALGIRGKGGLRKAFDFAVLCDYDFASGDRHTYVNFMKAGRVSEKDNVEYEAPGPFVIQGGARPISDNPLLETLPVWNIATDDPDQVPTEEEAQAVAAFEYLSDSGEFSWNKATQAAFGEGKVGKNYQDKLRRILDQFNVDYSDFVTR